MSTPVDAVRRGERGGKTFRLGIAGVVLATACSLVAAPHAAAQEQLGWQFVTEPDLHPPLVDTITPANGTLPGGIFIAPLPQGQPSGQPGPLIVDDQGQPIWFAPSPAGVAVQDFKAQTYQGKPVLTWWQGSVVVPPGYGEGEAVIMDQSYRQIATVRTGNGVRADLHDFVITPRDTALLLAYRTVPMDLTPVGGPADGSVYEGVVQEVDIATGRVLFEWNSLEHVGIDESFVPVSQDPAVPWDYFHINSVAEDGDGSLLISARNTHAVYQLNRDTGAVNWRLGGKRSDFRMGPGTGFEWQHDARRRPDGTITLFDNGAGGAKDRSRAITLWLDETARTAQLARDLPRADPVLSPNMGNHQVMPGGHAFVGWGGGPGYTEYAADGSVALHAEIADGMRSYRAYRKTWVGQPADDPEVAGVTDTDGGTDVYASWNGATEVATWRVLAGNGPIALEPVADAARVGFETEVDLPAAARYVAVEALDSEGNVLGRSPAEAVTG
ncbi:arylsulfotransferase family protein [Prauserella oleivorans]|uniref:Arylsulfotransferase family protein n=1 Tax=Prauserella oleivorans TaxID=1478153 RepID=A0ABW5WBS8_9PSEU